MRLCNGDSRNDYTVFDVHCHLQHNKHRVLRESEDV